MAVLENWKSRVKAIPVLGTTLRTVKRRLADGSEPKATCIQARRGWPKLNLLEIWQFRELLMSMAYRDFQIRYQQTVLGMFWAVIPTLFMGVFFMIFTRMAGLTSDGLPYAAFFFAAIVPWNYFHYILLQSSNSLTSNLHLLQKVYFPRLILPLKSALVGFVDFLLASSLILATMAYYGRWPGWNVLWLPVFVSLAVMTGLAIGVWFAALNVYFRDAVNFLPHLVQFWYFATPIFYSQTIVGPRWQTLFRLNPMASVVLGCRWCLFNDGTPPDWILAVVYLLTLAFLIGGLYFFRKVERTLADVV